MVNCEQATTEKKPGSEIHRNYCAVSGVFVTSIISSPILARGFTAQPELAVGPSVWKYSLAILVVPQVTLLVSPCL